MVDGAGERHVGNPWLFEIAWEVANKVGGIYTVIKTKVPVTVAEFQNRFVLIGPWQRHSAALEVDPLDVHTTHPRVGAALERMGLEGVQWLFGKWLVDGAPYVLLFDIGAMWHRCDEWKRMLWDMAQIPIPSGDTESESALILGELVFWFLKEFLKEEKSDAVMVHCHEWMAAVVLMYIKNKKIDVATLFTTHATLLGRYLCAGSADFYNHLREFDVHHEAGKRQIYHRYCIERAATHCADVFTTVSHITAYEAEHLLKRKPDWVVPNGLNITKFQAVHHFQNLHSTAKERIHDFVRGHFFGHVDFELDKTLYFFIAGRYEYRNKGVDMYLEGLARLNSKLKGSGSKVTVVAFVIMPAHTHSYTVEALRGQAVTKQLRDSVDNIQKVIGERIFDLAIKGRLPKPEELLTEKDLVTLKRRIFAARRDSLPAVTTHNLPTSDTDPILCQIRYLQLFNNANDRVKVVYHPEFLSWNNPLFGLDYEDFVRGCHLGVFPSYYEPWGYTPAECTVLGVPSITTNLSGFGCYMEENVQSPADYGIFIVDRRQQSPEESAEQLAKFMFQFSQRTRRQRINLRNRTERLSDILDWKRMGLEYVKARHLALRRKYPESFWQEFGEEEVLDEVPDKVPAPLSVPQSPKIKAFSKELTDEELAAQLAHRMSQSGRVRSKSPDPKGSVSQILLRKAGEGGAIDEEETDTDEDRRDALHRAIKKNGVRGSGR